MRQVINISLPLAMVKTVKAAVREGGYVTTSEFFRHLFRLWSTYKLAEELKQSRREFAAGKGKVLRSLKDLR